MSHLLEQYLVTVSASNIIKTKHGRHIDNEKSELLPQYFCMHPSQRHKLQHPVNDTARSFKVKSESSGVPCHPKTSSSIVCDSMIPSLLANSPAVTPSPPQTSTTANRKGRHNHTAVTYHHTFNLKKWDWGWLCCIFWCQDGQYENHIRVSWFLKNRYFMVFHLMPQAALTRPGFSLKIEWNTLNLQLEMI